MNIKLGMILFGKFIQINANGNPKSRGLSSNLL
jgi:hypothetical protein